MRTRKDKLPIDRNILKQTLLKPIKAMPGFGISFLLFDLPCHNCIIGSPKISIETFDPEIKYHRFRKIAKNGSPRVRIGISSCPFLNRSGRQIRTSTSKTRFRS
jgi:hypothetical protein